MTRCSSIASPMPWRAATRRVAGAVLRLLVLKHLYDWSFDEREREVRGHLVYRAVCRSGVTGCAGVGTVERPACSAGSGWAPSPTTSRSSAGPGRAPRDARWEGLDTMKGGAGKTERTNRDHAPHVAPLAPVRHHFCTGK
jgi:hypothetical protein